VPTAAATTAAMAELKLDDDKLEGDQTAAPAPKPINKSSMPRTTFIKSCALIYGS
jgi:hypothetical protein